MQSSFSLEKSHALEAHWSDFREKQIYSEESSKNVSFLLALLLALECTLSCFLLCRTEFKSVNKNIRMLKHFINLKYLMRCSSVLYHAVDAGSTPTLNFWGPNLYCSNSFSFKVAMVTFSNPLLIILCPKFSIWC